MFQPGLSEIDLWSLTHLGAQGHEVPSLLLAIQFNTMTEANNYIFVLFRFPHTAAINQYETRVRGSLQVVQVSHSGTVTVSRDGAKINHARVKNIYVRAIQQGNQPVCLYNVHVKPTGNVGRKQTSVCAGELPKSSEKVITRLSVYLRACVHVRVFIPYRRRRG